MPYLRFNIDLAIKLPLKPALSAKLSDMKASMLELKSHAMKINEGHSNEEDTVSVRQHICNHDIGKPCDELEDVK